MMKYIYGLAFLLLFAACSNTDSTADNEKAVEKILPYPIQQKKLANGLNVAVVEYPSPGLAAFQIVMRVGARDEVEEGKMLWDNQISSLKQVLGSA